MILVIAGTVVTRLLTAVRWAQAVTYRMILVIAGTVVTRLLTAFGWAQAVTYRMILVIAGTVVTRLLTAFGWAQAVSFRNDTPHSCVLDNVWSKLHVPSSSSTLDCSPCSD